MESSKPLFSLGRLSGAGKWVTVVVTTIAAIIGILVNARNLGLMPWLNIGSISFADLAARRILLSPGTDTLDAVGDTLHLAATVTDQHGSTLAGATILWSTDDSAVAVVDSAGGVIARGPGTATIGAGVRELNSRARITVWQRARSIAIAHDTLIRLPEGSTIQLDAKALDSRGHAVRGRGVRWVSSDTTVVVVQPSGLASARAPGRSLLTASTDGYTATVPAEVALTASDVKVVSGNDQRGPAGRKLALPVQVQVLSQGGRPVPDALVAFAAEGGEGSVTPETVTTDRGGRARAAWTLGSQAGRQHVSVTVGGVDSTLTLVAEADPVAGNTSIQPAREITPAQAGALLADSVGIRVTDNAGAAASDVPVTWTALDGGTIEAISSRTDSVGEAWARWTLGRKAGTQQARVQVGNPRTMPAFLLKSTALPEPAASVALVSGGNQQGKVGGVLKLSVVVQLSDRNGNAVAGGGVRVAGLAGSVTDTFPVADARGRVSIRWTLGPKAGAQVLELTPGSGTPLRITARALPLEPANVVINSAPGTSVVSRPLAQPIRATVTDAYGNTISDVQVVFSVSAGSAAPLRVMTDGKGQASTHWTLGATTGDQVLTAAVRGTTVKTAVPIRATKAASKK